MAQRTTPPDSSRPPTQKPFVRSEDISDAGWLIGIISVVLIFGIMIAFTALFGAPDQFPPGVLLVIVGVSSALFWGASYLLVRRKYRLPWSEIGLTFHNWRNGLLWAVGLFPLALLAYWLEDLGWRWMFYHRWLPSLSSWQSPLESFTRWGTNNSVIALLERVIAIIVVVISQGVFFWGMGYNAIERRTSSVLPGIFEVAFGFLVLYLILPIYPILLCLPFVSACVITFAYTRTRTLLTPLTMVIMLILFFLFVLQPVFFFVPFR